MQLEITRDVVTDLWPLCRSGEASSASQTLVAEFLAQDAQFATALRASDSLRGLVPPVRLSPDAELRLIRDVQQRARIRLLIIGGSIALAALLLFAAFCGAFLVVARHSF